MKLVRANRRSTPSPLRAMQMQLHQLVDGGGLLRGSLSQRAVVCGKPNCRCARGERHVALYLVVSTKGKVRQIHIPKAHAATVRLWVKQYQDAQRALHRLADAQLAALKGR